MGMSEERNLNQQMDNIRAERKRMKSRRSFFQKKLDALKRSKASVKASTDGKSIVPYQKVEGPSWSENITRLTEVDIDKWENRLRESQLTLEKVGKQVGRSLNTVSALTGVLEALKGVKMAKAEPIPDLEVDENDPDVRYLKVAKSVLHAIRNPDVRRVLAETSKAMKKKV